VIGDPTYSRRKTRELLSGLLRIAEARGTKRLLITSVSAGAGKTLLCKALREEAKILGGRTISFVSQRFLDRVEPSEVSSVDLVLVDGPASIEVDGLSDIPSDWRRALDGVVLVVVKRETQRESVQEARRWLEANGLPIVAVVWNEYRLPPLSVLFERLRRAIRFRKPNTLGTRPSASKRRDDDAGEAPFGLSKEEP